MYEANLQIHLTCVGRIGATPRSRKSESGARNSTNSDLREQTGETIDRFSWRAQVPPPADGHSFRRTATGFTGPTAGGPNARPLGPRSRARAQVVSTLSFSAARDARELARCI